MGLIFADFGDLGLEQAVRALGVLLLLLKHVVLAIHVDDSGGCALLATGAGSQG